MTNSKRGSTYIEILISLVIILLVINPIFSGIIYLKRNLNFLEDYKILENEIEKVRSFYKWNNIGIDYLSEDKEIIIDIKKKIIYEELYKFEIIIYKKYLKRESILYVYKQK
ncbi:hypothetical protein [Cetobacterium sp. ZOR0034]|uniref:hypothetical protein n=1 Tax=Cetobacterium sp. ZOR0034 TaxID=1339239 RepID=UPI0006474FA8|nr:hypothetical protein [Cetobacterium sp. ZOR0034]